MLKSFLEGFLGESQEKHESQLKFNCPRCSDYNQNTPDNKFNLEINLANDNPKYGSDKIFHCWKCGYKSGSLHKIIKDYGSREDYLFYRENSLDSLLYESPPKKQYKNIFLPNDFIKFKDFDLKNERHYIAYDYLIKERNIPEKTLNYFNVGACFNGFYKNRIIIPSYDKNNVLNFFTGRSFINEKPSYLSPSVHKDSIIINEKNINWNLPIFLVEGWFDLFALPVNTIPLNGKTILKSLFNKIKDNKPPLILIFDPDAISDMENIFYELSFFNLPFLKTIEIKQNDLAKNYQIKGKKYIFELTKEILN